MEYQVTDIRLNLPIAGFSCSYEKHRMTPLGVAHIVKEWRAFIDSSKRSLKAVLLHIGNKIPSIPIAHFAQLKESYDSIEILLNTIYYSGYQCSLCGDFKVIGILMGLQGVLQNTVVFYVLGQLHHCTALRNKTMADKEFICT